MSTRLQVRGLREPEGFRRIQADNSALRSSARRAIRDAKRQGNYDQAYNLQKDAMGLGIDTRGVRRSEQVYADNVMDYRDLIRSGIRSRQRDNMAQSRLANPNGQSGLQTGGTTTHRLDGSENVKTDPSPPGGKAGPVTPPKLGESGDRGLRGPAGVPGEIPPAGVGAPPLPSPPMPGEDLATDERMHAENKINPQPEARVPEMNYKRDLYRDRGGFAESNEPIAVAEPEPLGDKIELEKGVEPPEGYTWVGSGTVQVPVKGKRNEDGSPVMETRTIRKYEKTGQADLDAAKATAENQAAWNARKGNLTMREQNALSNPTPDFREIALAEAEGDRKRSGKTYRPAGMDDHTYKQFKRDRAAADKVAEKNRRQRMPRGERYQEDVKKRTTQFDDEFAELVAPVAGNTVEELKARREAGLGNLDEGAISNLDLQIQLLTARDLWNTYGNRAALRHARTLAKQAAATT